MKVDEWLATHPGWSVKNNGLSAEFKTADFATALAAVVRIGLAAEKRDHHPDITLAWGKVGVFWTTHDSGGITDRDFELAEKTDAIFRG